jgi:hypothetical protein
MRLRVTILPEEIESARRYSGLSLDHTRKKLEQQQSRHSVRLNRHNIIVGRVARDVLGRVLGDRGIPTTCEESSPREWKHFCLATTAGIFLQVRYISNRPNYVNLLEDVHSFNRRPHDFYIATTSKDELQTLEIIGYATRDEMERHWPRDFGQAIFNRYAPLAVLHPFEELVNELLSGSRAALQSRS